MSFYDGTLTELEYLKLSDDNSTESRSGKTAASPACSVIL
jgi:hypothetical protein